MRILNPVAGGARFTSEKRARRFVRAGRAHLDASGQLVFHGIGKSQRGASLLVSAFSGCDARPDMPVLPPSAEVLARMGNHSRVLRPPVRGGAD